MQSAFQKGSELIAQSLGNASEKAAITAMSGATNLLTGSAAASAQDKIAAASDAVQMKAIDVTIAQIVSQTKLTNTIEVANSLTRQAQARKDKGESSPEYQSATTAVNAAEKVQAAFGSKGGIQKLYNQGLAKGASQEEIQAASQLNALVQAIAGGQAQKIELRGKGLARDASAAGMAPVFQAQENTTPALLQQKARNTLELERLGILRSIVGAENEGMIKQRISVELSNAELEAGVSFVETNAKIVGLQAQLKTSAGAMLDPQLRSERSQTISKQLREAELSILKQTSIVSKGSVDLQAEKLNRLAKELTIATALKDIENLRYSILLDVQDAQNAADFAAGKISEDDKNRLDFTNANARALEDANNKRITQLEIIQTAQDTYNESVSKLKEADTEEKQAAINRYNDTAASAGAALEKINIESEGKRKILELNKKLTTQEELFRSTTLTGLNNISDAFVDFALTGKNSFADMVNSMLLDLAKLEMRMALMKGLQGVGGTQGLFNGFMSLFNQSPSGANPMQLDPAQMAAATIVPSALGTAWDAGIKKFAMGASFTNSIVDSPTMFKFAQGTGLMGEAGPEAIMPLKRDANGNLGVRSGQSGNEVNVVVNNYSKETATTNETIDSRGQRRIEVTIGNMIAGEIARGGSSAQNSIRGTFGQQPQLLRR